MGGRGQPSGDLWLPSANRVRLSAVRGAAATGCGTDQVWRRRLQEQARSPWPYCPGCWSRPQPILEKSPHLTSPQTDWIVTHPPAVKGQGSLLFPPQAAFVRLHLHWGRKAQGTHTVTTLTTNIIKTKFTKERINLYPNDFILTHLKQWVSFFFEHTLPSSTDSGTKVINGFLHPGSGYLHCRKQVLLS